MTETKAKYLQSNNDSNKEYPLVSVIMNCYNGDRYLANAVNSVLEQTYSNWEIIFWDNLSTDNSLDIIRRFKDERIKYFLADSHTNLNTARNLAIQRSEGEFIAFLDVDDLWDKEKLSRQIPLFQDPQVGFVFGNFFVMNERFSSTKYRLAYQKPLPQGFIATALFKGLIVGLLTLVIRRSAILDISSVFDSRFTVIGDIVLTRTLSLDWKAAAVNTPIAYYRLHDTNYTLLNPDGCCDELEEWISTLPTNSPIFQSSMFIFQKNFLLKLKINKYLSQGEFQKAKILMNSYPRNHNKILLASKFVVFQLLGFKIVNKLWNFYELILFRLQVANNEKLKSKKL